MGTTMLIGLDGATFSVLDPYVDEGVMPFLGELLNRGSRAVLRSIMPPLTPPAWTSLVTGKHPGQHGVFDFFQKQEPGSVYFSFASSMDVRSATI
ncbi:MAG: alkaline phosphatase family protein, partial [Solirubrobacteraceae bacterium]